MLQAAAAALALLVAAPAVSLAAPPPFTDLGPVPSAAPAIAQLQQLGVVEGVGAGRFDPLAPVTPAEVATMAGRLFRWDPLPGAAPADTPAWAAGYLGHAVSRGYAAPAVDPSGPSPLGELVLSIEAGMGWKGGIAEAEGRGLLCGGVPLTSLATRAEAALLLYRAAYVDRIAAWAGYQADYTLGGVSLSHGVPLVRMPYRPGCRSG